MFEAKVTENISEGYTIETVIDGKPLRGILFLNKQHSLQPAAHVFNRSLFFDSSPPRTIFTFRCVSSIKHLFLFKFVRISSYA